MRWNEKPPLKKGERRYRSGILWLPKRIGNEWRWLEPAGWIEEVTTHINNLCGPYLDWCAVRWADKPESEDANGS